MSFWQGPAMLTGTTTCLLWLALPAFAADYKAGDKVIADLKGTANQATVVSVEKGGKYKLEWSDGAKEVVAGSRIKTAVAPAGTAFKKGDKVLVVVDGAVYPGTVNYPDGADYRIDYEDGEQGSETVAGNRVLALVPVAGMKLAPKAPEPPSEDELHPCKQVDNLFSIKRCGGKCADTRSDAMNCGHCGTKCGQGVVCIEGWCKMP
jgi:hypothetical protein